MTTPATTHPRRAAAWIYRGVWSILIAWFRAPDMPPDLPVGPDESIQTFRPAPGFLGYLRLWFVLITAAIALGLVGLWIAVLVEEPILAALRALPMLVLVVAGATIGYLGIHLRYDTTWYVMSERSLRIRRGAFIVQEMTITFENVQNVSVRQGPVQRACGIANVIVETAGASGDAKQSGIGRVSNQGVIEGLGNAMEMRDLVLSRLKHSRGAGLGDDGAAVPAGWSAAHVAMLRDIRDTLAGSAAS